MNPKAQAAAPGHWRRDSQTPQISDSMMNWGVQEVPKGLLLAASK
jgi:hypothetical protein